MQAFYLNLWGVQRFRTGSEWRINPSMTWISSHRWAGVASVTIPKLQSSYLVLDSIQIIKFNLCAKLKYGMKRMWIKQQLTSQRSGFNCVCAAGQIPEQDETYGEDSLWLMGVRMRAGGVMKSVWRWSMKTRTWTGGNSTPRAAESRSDRSERRMGRASARGSCGSRTPARRRRRQTLCLKSRPAPERLQRDGARRQEAAETRRAPLPPGETGASHMISQQLCVLQLKL